MTALPLPETVVPSSTSFDILQTANANAEKVIVDTSSQRYESIEKMNDYMVEESLECTAVISPTATTLVSSATTGDESDTKVFVQDAIAPQSCLLSLNDGPTNHQVHVNYIALQLDTSHERKTRVYRRSKSTGNLPNDSSLKNRDGVGGLENNVNPSQMSIDIASQAVGAASSTTNNNSFAGWLVSVNDPYSCDVGNTMQAITTIAFPGSSSDLSTTKRQENDDETSSFGSGSSVAYFDPSDFDSSMWQNVVWNHASTTAVGIVTFVALTTTAIAHPLFFLAASTLAAIGTFTAAITHRGTSSSSQSSTNTEANLNNKSETDGENIEESSISNTAESSWSACFCLDNPFQSSNDDVPKSIKNQTDTIEEIPESAKVMTIVESQSVSLLNVEQNPIKRRKLSKDDQVAWRQKHFPRLYHRVGPTGRGGNNISKSSTTLVGLNAIDCFRVFFDNTAPYNFLALQEKRGDLHIQYGLWNSLAMTGRISMFDQKDSMPFPKDIYIQSYQGRLITFHAKTNAMFGPPYAKTTKIQKFLLVNRRLAILENKTTLSGIPFSDRFYVGERWIFEAEKVHNEHYITHVHVECEVFFHQGGCPFEQQIKSKSISTINDVVSSWCIMAVEALKLTEMAKLDRLHRTMDDDPDDDETVDDVVTKETMPTDTNNQPNHDDAVEVVADASLLSDDIPVTTNKRPRSALRGINHFVRHRRSFEDDCAVKK